MQIAIDNINVTQQLLFKNNKIEGSIPSDCIVDYTVSLGDGYSYTGEAHFQYEDELSMKDIKETIRIKENIKEGGGIIELE